MWYADVDGDGHAGPEGVWACAAPAPEFTDLVGIDCDDGDALVYPGASETCDGRANDCDAVGWAPENEMGTALLVEFTEGGPVRSDLTATLKTGSSKSPARLEFAPGSDTELNFCAGLHHVSIVARSAHMTVTGPYEGRAMLSASGAARVIEALDSSVEVRAVTLSNGSADVGGGIFAQASSIDLDGVLLVGNVAELGGGIAAVESTVRIANSHLVDNEAESGGAAYIRNGELILQQSFIASNVADVGGGLLLDAGAAEAWVQSQDAAWSDNSPEDIRIATGTEALALAAPNGPFACVASPGGSRCE
jgi:hypothetical protein